MQKWSGDEKKARAPWGGALFILVTYIFYLSTVVLPTRAILNMAMGLFGLGLMLFYTFRQCSKYAIYGKRRVMVVSIPVVCLVIGIIVTVITFFK